jgi:hypothetical protein
VNLSEHFTLEELVASQLAARQRIDNRPTPVIIENLRKVAAVLEQIRTLVGKPVAVSSGYRSVALNKAVGGAPASAHLDGLAADITVSGMTSRELAGLIRDSGIVLDQLIYEGTWVHVGLTNGKPRRQVLTARFGQGGTTYSQGIA